MADGVDYYEIRERSEPWNIYAVEIDLENEKLNLGTLIANNSLLGYETMSAMLKRVDTSTKTVVAAINGDFYDGYGRPTNTQILDGEILKQPNKRPILLFNGNKEFDIGQASYRGAVYNGIDTIAISGVNRIRGEDELIFYNMYYGKNTGTNRYGTELILRRVNSPMVNGEFKTIIINKFTGTGNARVAGGFYVLSGHGVASDRLIRAFDIGDTLTIDHELLGTDLKNLTGAIGGSDIIVKNGQNTYQWPERHPRTAVGYNKEQTRLYLIVVDGRQIQSAGMTLGELGDFMLTTPIFNAINLDGGASTTMIINDEVVNSPSLLRERTVSNGLYIYMDTAD